MAATSAYDYVRETFNESVDGNTATRVWNIRGPQDVPCTSSLAFDSTPEAGSPPIAKVNEKHPDDSSLLCRSRSFNRKHLYAGEVVASYGIPPGGGEWVILKPSDPLSQRPSVSWRDGVIGVPTDRDLAGRRRINSAGSAFDPPATQNIPVKYLSVVKWEEGYDYNTYRQYENATNSKPITVGKVTFFEGEVLCTTIQPTEAYDPAGTILPMGYDFSILRLYQWRDGKRDGSGKLERIPYPWYAINALLDQGTEAWVNDGTVRQAKICRVTTTATGTSASVIDDPVPLNGKGIPIDTTLRATVDGTTALTIVSPPTPSWPDDYIAPTSTDNSKSIWFWDFHIQDFNALKVFSGL